MKTMKFFLASILLCSSALTCFAAPAPRVQFQWGTHSVVLRGVSSPAHPNTIYTFRARRGQNLSASVRSTTRGFVPLLFITSPSGRNLIEDKQTRYSARLSEGGNYSVRVAVNQMATNVRRGTFQLRLSIR